MKVPKSFSLHGQRIAVTMVDHLSSENNALGEARILKNEIALQQNTNGFSLPQSQIEQTFFHELTHFILHHMGQDDLCAEEAFVDGFAALLHQALTTAEYSNTTGGKRGK